MRVTPYMLALARFFPDQRYETAVLVCGTQMAKTEGILDAIGWRLATRPRPALYVGPSKDFVTEQFEPRLMAMLDGAKSLEGRIGRGKLNKKTRKVVNGSSIRLAWAGSETSLSSDQAGDIYIDEYDKMLGRTKGTGDVFGLAKARGDSYRDRKVAVTSTPKRGRVNTVHDEASGLEFWAMADTRDLESPIWAKWQEGTRHHWSWCCPHCGEWFVPRTSLLRCDEGASPAEARRKTWLVCPRNGCIIEESVSKDAMNASGQFVAPGQWINDDNVLEGEPVDSSIFSMWVSGLASPFLSWGERLEEIMLADRSGNDEARQGALNKCGELFARDQGVVPEWQELRRLCLPYRMGDLPAGVLILTAGVDVQGNRLVVIIMGWGRRGESWLIHAVEIWGDTKHDDVWNDLVDFLRKPMDGLVVRRAFVDAGFRPGGVKDTPEHKVHVVCAHFPTLLTASKGYASRSMPLSLSSIETTPRGTSAKRYGLQLARLDTDFFKSRVHERFSWPDDQPGAFHLPEDVPDGCLKQLVSEARVVNDSGKVEWIQRARDNHFLDATALADAAGYHVGVQRISDRTPDRRSTATDDAAGEQPKPAAKPPSENPYFTDGKTVRTTPVLDEHGGKPPLTNRKPSLADICNNAPTWDEVFDGTARI